MVYSALGREMALLSWKSVLMSDRRALKQGQKWS